MSACAVFSGDRSAIHSSSQNVLVSLRHRVIVPLVLSLCPDLVSLLQPCPWYLFAQSVCVCEKKHKTR